MHSGLHTIWFRLILVLSLMWIVPGISVQSFMIGHAVGLKPPIHDDLFCVMFVGTSLFIAAVFMLWWRFISWTFGRITGTGCTTAAVMGHLLLWKPLWAAGCTEGFLLLGQSLSAGGLWMIITAYLWWGLAEGIVYWRKRAMSPSAVRLIYGMSLIPFIPGLWFLLILASGEFVFKNEKLSMAAAHLICGLIVVTWWLLIWRRAIIWTPTLVRRIGAMTVGYLLLGTLSSFLPDRPDWLTSMRITVPLMLTGLWFAITAWTWRTRMASGWIQPSEIKDVIKCASCGYSLIGLYESRCPECGRTRTLDELFEDMLAARHGI